MWAQLTMFECFCLYRNPGCGRPKRVGMGGQHR